jgi:hypothetical protein
MEGDGHRVPPQRRAQVGVVGGEDAPGPDIGVAEVLHGDAAFEQKLTGPPELRTGEQRREPRFGIGADEASMRSRETSSSSVGTTGDDECPEPTGRRRRPA